MSGVNILVTGCCGYIGSHTCVELLEANYNVIGIDNFSNSRRKVLDEIYKITEKKIVFYEGDILDYCFLKKVFLENSIDFVIDFAASKSVGDSISDPIAYYKNNVNTLINLLEIMNGRGVKKLIFSSTAAVYGKKDEMPIGEEAEIGNTTNPYATSKYFDEKILKDTFSSDSEWSICIFRYFNPVGAHISGVLGEDPTGVPTNLMPCILRSLKNENRQVLTIFGDDYDTYDGTGIRDYIHVVDLAKAHVKGIEYLMKMHNGVSVFNLGTGRGYSVLEIIETFEKVNGVKINYTVGKRRDGDVASCYAGVLKAEKNLKWKAELDLEEMCRDAYNYYKYSLKTDL